MRGGFTFKDVDIADVFLSYAPELGDTYVYRPAETNIHEETFDGHDGGYFYGLTKQPKEIILRCFFEQKNIDRGVMEKIHWLFRKGSSGKLVFQQRPWCYYYATVTEVDDKELFNYLNGFIKVTMKAYYPLARSDYSYFPRNCIGYFKVMESTAFFEDENMMPDASLIGNNPLSARKSFLLYNPGTEYADVGIEIAGDAVQGVVIENLTTKQKCKFIGLTKEITSDANKYVYYDGINGKCVLKSDTATEMNSLYHDSGYINLAPGYPVYRDIYVENISYNTVRVTNILYDVNIEENTELAKRRYVGKYIYLNQRWIKINDVLSEHSLLLAENAGVNSTQRTVIATMNELVVYPVASMSLTKLNFKYKPTFA